MDFDLESLMVSGFTHVDLYFLPTGELPLLGWSEPALKPLLSGGSALGRPVIQHFIEHCADDITLTSSVTDAEEEPARARRMTVLRESTPTQGLFARVLQVTPLSASEFPSRRSYDSVRHVTRARWTLHNRVRLLADCAYETALKTNSTTLCLRYNHAPNVDLGAVQAALRRGIQVVQAVI